MSWLLDDSAGEGTVEGIRTSSANANGSEQTLIRLSIRASLKRTGKEMKFIVEGVTNSAPADTTLIRLLVRGQKIAKRMFGSNCPPLEAIAHEERITASYATRLVRLAFLAPDGAAILAGKQPPGLSDAFEMAVMVTRAMDSRAWEASGLQSSLDKPARRGA